MKIEDLNQIIETNLDLKLSIEPSKEVEGVIVTGDGYFTIAADHYGFSLEIYNIEDVTAEDISELKLRIAVVGKIGNLMVGYCRHVLSGTNVD